MQLNDVILLAAPTSRSQAYLQTLAARQLLPAQVILMGSEAATSLQTTQERDWHGIKLPDLTLSITATCASNNVPLKQIDTNTVNSPLVADTIKQLNPKIVIYSGFGGQIVSREILNLGAAFLHMHSGSLPLYRGSTTLYYALLNNENPSVTAILLDPEIDTGPIIAEKQYPMPIAGIDIDRIYDAAIRADLLSQVMQDYSKNGKLTEIKSQSKSEGHTYYVIHPVLKHIALLSLNNQSTKTLSTQLTDCVQDESC